MLNKEDRLKIAMTGILTNEHHKVLQLLYGPLLGKDALTLYELLVSLQAMPQKIKNHLLLQKLSGQSMELIAENRMILEQYLLVKTYYDGAKNAYIYELMLPKAGNQFLAHDVFGRLYLQKMGKQVYEYMKRSFASDEMGKDTYQEISAHMSALFHDWDDGKEAVFAQLRPVQANPSIRFNFDQFLNGLSAMVLPLKERTKENLDYIAEKADLYGIDEKEMQKLVGKSIDMKENRLDRKKLIRYIQNSHQEFIKKVEDPYALPPIRFLQEKQNGIAVAKADQNLIDSLLYETYHLSGPLINVLLEYVLERCHQTLSKAYVEKVAATWVRLGIDTKEKAFALIQAEKQQAKPKQAKKELPEWYHQDHTMEDKAEIDDDTLMEELRKLRE